MLSLNDLLRGKQIDPKRVAIVLNSPRDPEFRRALPWIARDRPELLRLYNSYFGPRQEATLRRRKFMLSFTVQPEPVLAGAYEIAGYKETLDSEFRANPDFSEVLELANEQKGSRTKMLEFSLRDAPVFNELIGRLVIDYRRSQAYVRLAENFDAQIVKISEHDLLTFPPVDWRDFILSANDVRNLPSSWAVRLREWRGIYLIVDESDGARYVGSASGSENLLGRWRTHVSGDRGVTLELKKRRVDGFRFSILERLSPDLSQEEVVRVENSWKERLHTGRWGLNQN